MKPKVIRLISLTKTPRNPYPLFEQWLELAIAAGLKLPNAMTLATASKSGAPAARIVLLKDVGPKGICFFTNYRSRKAAELHANPRATLLFYWPELDLQVRIDGRVKKVSARESDAYFATRPRESQIGAHASRQSRSDGRPVGAVRGVREAVEKVRGERGPQAEALGRLPAGAGVRSSSGRDATSASTTGSSTRGRARAGRRRCCFRRRSPHQYGGPASAHPPVDVGGTPSL